METLMYADSPQIRPVELRLNQATLKDLTDVDPNMRVIKARQNPGRSLVAFATSAKQGWQALIGKICLLTECVVKTRSCTLPVQHRIYTFIVTLINQPPSAISNHHAHYNQDKGSSMIRMWLESCSHG